MGFALKKVAEWCASPFGLALLLIGLGLAVELTRTRRLGRWLVAAGFATLVVFSLHPVAVGLGRPLAGRFPALTAAEPLDGVAAVAVLGAGYAREQGRPPTAWLTATGLERLVEGVRVLRLAPASRLVVSGRGDRDEPSTAAVMELAAVSLGVDPARIVRLDDPRDTAEEIAALRALVGKQRVAIVTSAEHMPRAMALAARAGLDAVAAPVSAPTGDAGDGVWLVVPSVTALENSSLAIHELFGLAWAALVGLT